MFQVAQPPSCNAAVFLEQGFDLQDHSDHFLNTSRKDTPMEITLYKSISRFFLTEGTSATIFLSLSTLP